MSSNPFSALIDNQPAAADTTVSRETALIENVFGFTANRERSVKQKLVHLDESYLPTQQLDRETLEFALFERLLMPHDDIVRHGARGETAETTVIKYLHHCFRNNLANPDQELKAFVQHTIIGNIVTGLKQPELYENQNLFEQLFDILSDSKLFDDLFFNNVYNAFISNMDEYEAMIEVYSSIYDLIFANVARMTLITLRPSVLELLKHMVQFEHLADVFIIHSTPRTVHSGLDYDLTLLGALINISILPKTAKGKFEYFQSPLDQASNEATEAMLYRNADVVIQTVHQIFLSLLKANAGVRAKTLTWLGACLDRNMDRRKLWNAQLGLDDFNVTRTVSDGFMLNLCAILMKLCQPFCGFEQLKKILKVDPTYCLVPKEKVDETGVHLTNMSTETFLMPQGDDDQVQVEGECVTSLNYNFITECFYMAHKAMELGFRVVSDKLVRLNQEMARIERSYNEALVQEGPDSDIVDLIKTKMRTEMSRYLSIKATLSNPNFLENTFHVMSATCYWLNQCAVNYPNGQRFTTLTEQPIKFPQTNQTSCYLKYIPELMLENIINYVIFLRRFNPKVFELHGYKQMEPMLTFILIYMSSNKRVKNPHVRAHLAEGLESLLPFHSDEPKGLNPLGGYQREMLFKQHAHRREIVKSLLEVFVSIEMTGESVQFEQKFNYRRPMYLIIQYLWGLDEHQQYFVELAEDAERNMEAVNPPLFLRFINLMMNDAVYLLDEALSNMSKLKEMQQARENGEWDNLSGQERAQNIGYMQHIGMLAKFDNILGKDTIDAIKCLTSKIQIVFTHATMVDRVASMLNYFLYKLVGPNQKKFKVKDYKEYSFDPADTVLDICTIYVHLKESDAFCLAISQDGRSYSPKLFDLAADVLQRIGGGQLIGELGDLATKVVQLADEYKAREESIADVPEHFLDPIMSTLMNDPVILPSSRQTVDRTTIARHLLSDQTDPFNRSPLTMDQLIPNEELAEEIRQWFEAQHKPLN